MTWMAVATKYWGHRASRGCLKSAQGDLTKQVQLCLARHFSATLIEGFPWFFLGFKAITMVQYKEDGRTALPSQTRRLRQRVSRCRKILPCDYAILVSKSWKTPNQKSHTPKVYTYLPSTSLICPSLGVRPKQGNFSVNAIPIYSALCLLFSPALRSNQRMA